MGLEGFELGDTGNSENSGAAKCGTFIAHAQGGETEDMTRLINDYVSKNAHSRIVELTGGKLGDLGEALKILMTKNSDYIESLRSGNLYNEWINQKDSINSERVKIIVKAREFYDSGDFENDYINPIIASDISGFIIPLQNWKNDISLNFYTINNIYNDISSSMTVLQNLLDMKEEVLFNKIGKIQQYEKKNNVDIRKNLYEYERTTLYYNIYNILKYIYYAIFVIYIIFGNFFREKMYKNYNFYIIALLYLILPYTLKYIFGLIIYIYELTMNFFGIHKEIYTYSDYVRASNIDNIYTAAVPSVIDKNGIINGYNKFIVNNSNDKLDFINNVSYNNSSSTSS